MSSATVPDEIGRAAARGELQKVVKWLRKGGHVDALFSWEDKQGRSLSSSLLHAAAGNGHLAVAKELLKRSASVDLSGSDGVIPLMTAAVGGQPAVLLLLLEHSASPDLQDDHGTTAPMTRLLAQGTRSARRPCSEPTPTPSCATRAAAPL